MRILIDGNVEHTKARLSDLSCKSNDVAYICDGTEYSDIEDVFHCLLKQRRYALLKDFNECEFLLENVRGGVFPRRYYPMRMQIEHTSFCNARCIMCFHYYMHNRAAQHMDASVYAKVREWLPFVRVVGLHGFGEPFLAPDLPNYLKDYHHFGIRLFTNTNLSVLPDYLGQYYDDFDFINISCDGVSREVFEGIRQNISFDTFIQNVRRLRREAPKVKLVLAAVLMRQNLHQCEQFVHLASDLGLDRVTFSKVGINYAIGNYEDSVDNYPETLQRRLDSAIEAGQKLGVQVIVPRRDDEVSRAPISDALTKETIALQSLSFWSHHPEDALERILQTKRTNPQLYARVNEKCYSSTDRAIRGVCDWMTSDIYISAVGRVGFCCSNYRYYIGDLRNESLDAIWQGEHYSNMIHSFQSGYLPSFCQYCNLYEKGLLPGLLGK